jgi:hypothetical protein
MCLHEVRADSQELLQHGYDSNLLLRLRSVFVSVSFVSFDLSLLFSLASRCPSDEKKTV